MEKEKFAAALYVMVVLMTLSSSPGTAGDFNANGPVQMSTATRSSHEARANYYEEAASDMQAKVDEQNSLLKHYETKSYLYGRRAQDLKSATHALVRKYDRAAKVNMTEALFHRQMARQLVVDQS
ncbi:MAG: hypothetical protein H0X43_13655 [Nitrosospira sp.]|nr:hypothetical protein [Nitrosospira sp.]